MIATHPFETARESVLPLWSQAAQARRSAPDACAPELFVFLHGMLFTNIQLDDFSATLSRLLERLSIEEPEEREWTMMATVNVGALLEYGRPQGVLRRSGALGPVDRNLAAMAAASKVKLARKAQADDRMEVDGDERRQSSDLEAGHARSPSAIQVLPVLSDTAASLEPPPAFKMAQELTFALLAHALRSKCDGPNSYVTIILTFLQTVLQHPEGLAALERAIPWSDLAAFLGRGPRVSSNYTQSEKLSKSSILSGIGPSVGWCGLGGSSNVDSGTAVTVTSWKWKCWTHATPLPRHLLMMACGKTTSTKATNPAARSLAGRRLRGGVRCGLARRLPRSPPVSDGMESVNGGLKVRLQRRPANGRKKTDKPVRRRSAGRWGGVEST